MMGKQNHDSSKKGKISDSQKKYIGLLLLISAVGIVFIMLGNGITNNQQMTMKNDVAQENISDNMADISDQDQTKLSLYEKSMENELINILQAVNGVGDVMAKVTLEATAETYYASNTQNNQMETNEPLENGDKRSTKELREDVSVVMKNVGQGQDEPVVIKETRPAIVGVLIVAEGASNLQIKEQISNAVQVLLDVPSHKVSVLAKVKED